MTMTQSVPTHAAVWFEIPVIDIKRSMGFYGSVLGNELTLEEDGPNPMALFPASGGTDSVRGHLYPGTPPKNGNGPTIHLAVAAPLEAAMQRVTENGGKVVSPAIEIPVGRFAYCVDPDGNSFGLFV
jgi:predicted enzyme related to lactoylglutathione lyase